MPPTPIETPFPHEDAPLLGRVLAAVRARHGVDFGAYRPATVARRVRNRMISTGDATLAAYAARLEADPAEPSRLLQRLTVKVSRFYRNAATFALLERALADRAAVGRPLRAWSAGCGHGEEAWSIAMALAEAGAADARVLATDVDPAALAAAAHGRYGPPAFSEAPPERVARHLEPPAADGSREVRPALRDRVAFCTHDLTSLAAPPGGPFDLVACRNVLIYFQRPVQEQVTRLLCDQVARGGLLCLGEAEWLPPRVAEAFDVLDRRARLFARR